MRSIYHLGTYYKSSFIHKSIQKTNCNKCQRSANKKSLQSRLKLNVFLSKHDQTKIERIIRKISNKIISFSKYTNFEVNA